MKFIDSSQEVWGRGARRLTEMNCTVDLRTRLEDVNLPFQLDLTWAWHNLIEMVVLGCWWLVLFCCAHIEDPNGFCYYYMLEKRKGRLETIYSMTLSTFKLDTTTTQWMEDGVINLSNRANWASCLAVPSLAEKCLGWDIVGQWSVKHPSHDDGERLAWICKIQLGIPFVRFDLKLSSDFLWGHSLQLDILQFSLCRVVVVEWLFWGEEEGPFEPCSG